MIERANGLSGGLLLAYSVEKLGFFVNSIKFGDLYECKLLFLLEHVSAGTSQNRRKGVFQQNRPTPATHHRLTRGTGVEQ